MTIYRLLYRSEIAIDGASDTVRETVDAIVAGSAIRNARDGITGALMISSGVFLQALEGEPAAVETAFERICRDLRHRRVRLLEYTIAEDRAFADWAMVQVTPTREIAKLCLGVDLVDDRSLDAAAASSTIQVMHALLMTKAAVISSRTARPSAA